MPRAQSIVGQTHCALVLPPLVSDLEKRKHDFLIKDLFSDFLFLFHRNFCPHRNSLFFLAHTDEYIKLLRVLATFQWEVGTFYNGTSFFFFKPEVGTVSTRGWDTFSTRGWIDHHHQSSPITHQPSLTSHQGEREREHTCSLART